MPDVWLISGIPGAGKTTVADLLARRFEQAVHVDARAELADVGLWLDSSDLSAERTVDVVLAG